MPESVSYSQSGEDLICRRTLSRLGIQNPTYLDIGAAHPTELSNTFLFYSLGNTGTVVEPNPKFAELLRGERPKDTVIEAAIGERPGTAELELSENPFLGSCSQSSTPSPSESTTVEVVTLSAVLEQHSTECPDFISIDTEGQEERILQVWDFSRYKPSLFCIETIVIDDKGTETKRVDIHEMMKENGYMHFADTYINSIYVLEQAWRNRSQ